MTKRPTNSLTILMGAGIAVAATASASMWVSSAPATVDGVPQSAHPSQVQLACPSGIVDPFETTNVAAGTTWSSLATAPVSPAPVSVTGQGGVIPTALTLAGQGGGELAGLSAVGCAAARTSQWIATGATTAGADMVLILSSASMGTARRARSTPHRVRSRSRHVPRPRCCSPGGSPTRARWPYTCAPTGEGLPPGRRHPS